ncbi:MAG TPA: hypothetical protein VHP11_07260 [Tepidisphaeraceae bacterium]|nr:hypothetical protein [Tepidisphaeraceae bacterium]
MQEQKKPGNGGNTGNVNPAPSTPTTPAAKAGAPAPQPHACPECGKVFRTDEAVQTHRYAAHGTAEAVVGDMTRCPECGSLVKNSHMAKHKRRMHGIV